jgi:hypothetical protein
MGELFVKRFRLPARPLSGMRMVVRTRAADVGMPWFCETDQEIDAGVPALRVSPGCVVNAGIRLLAHHGTPRVACAQVSPFGREAGMQVLYERCAAVDVGKDVIAVAVRAPGDGPNGPVMVKRTFKAFYGVLAEAARWLTSLGVTHVAMEATGIYSMPVYHALVEHGNFEKVLVCNAGHVKNVPGRKTDRRRVAGAPAGVRAAGRQLHPADGDQGGPGRDPLSHESGPAAGQRDCQAGQRAAGRRQLSGDREQTQASPNQGDHDSETPKSNPCGYRRMQVRRISLVKRCGAKTTVRARSIKLGSARGFGRGLPEAPTGLARAGSDQAGRTVAGSGLRATPQNSSTSGG